MKSGNEELDNKDSVAEIRDEPTWKVSYDSLSSQLLDKEDIMTNNVKGCQENDVCTVHLVNILKSGLYGNAHKGQC